MNVWPDLRVDCVEMLDAATLRRHDLKGLLVDVDETLLAAAATRVDDSVATWLDALVRDGVLLALVSNGTRERVDSVARRAGIPAEALAGKPHPRAFRRAIETLGISRAHVAMVGDQLFTDVLGAHLAGIRSILVPPRSNGGLPHTRALRRLERAVLARAHHVRGDGHGLA